MVDERGRATGEAEGAGRGALRLNNRPIRIDHSVGALA